MKHPWAYQAILAYLAACAVLVFVAIVGKLL